MKIKFTVILLITAFHVMADKPQTISKTRGKDDQKIIRRIPPVFNGTDERNWAKVKNGMEETVLLDYSSLSGAPASMLPAKEIIEVWKSVLPCFDRTHHQLSNLKITKHTNSATVRYGGKADHFIDAEVWTGDGTCDNGILKVNESWVVAKHKLNLGKVSGNTSQPSQAIQRLTNNKSVTMKKVNFKSEGSTIVGNLFLPDDLEKGEKRPAILVGGSWTTVKEQMAGSYAKLLAEKGFITLAIDPRGFGESEGTPRFYESPDKKIQDYKNAISFLLEQPGVDPTRLSLVAVCASGGYMVRVASEDSRVKAIATVAGWFHDGEAVKLFYGGEEGVQQRVRAAQAAKRKYSETGTVEYIASISETDKTAAMYGPFDYYLNAKRGAIPQWSADKFAVMSWEDWLTFNPMPVAKKLNIPTLMIHSNDAVLPDNVKTFFNDVANQHKELYWTTGSQFDFYDQPTQMKESVNQINNFFTTQLN